MDFSTEAKKQILEGFVDIISRFASKSYQNRIWIRGEGPEVDAFDDAVAITLDNLGLFYLIIKNLG